MKVFRNKYGWSTSAHSKDRDGNEIKCYLDVSFKKGGEPISEPLEGELFFRDTDGKEWPAFFSSYMKQGQSVPKMVLMPAGTKPREIPKRSQEPLTDGNGRDMFNIKRESKPQEVVIDSEELPFY